MLSYHSPLSLERDRICWKLGKNGIFASSSLYHALRGVDGGLFPWKSIWCVKAPSRVSFFVWIAAWGRILNCDNLRHGYSMADWCCMCRCSKEVVDDLLLHCRCAYELWSFFFFSLSPGLWDLVGAYREGYGSLIWLEELFWKA